MIRLDFGLHSWLAVPLMKKSPKIENAANWSYFHLIDQFWHVKSIEIHSWWLFPMTLRVRKSNMLQIDRTFILWINFDMRHWLEMVLELSDLILASIPYYRFRWWKRVRKSKMLKIDQIHPINQFWQEKLIENLSKMILLESGLHSWLSVPLMKKSSNIENVANWSNFQAVNYFWPVKSIENGFIVIRLDFCLHSWWSVPLMKQNPKIKIFENLSNFLLTNQF